MSYNILADRLASLPKFREYVPQVVRDFGFRSRRIIGELVNANADLVCLQEVDNFEEFYKEQLARLGYETLFRPKAAPEFAQQHGIATAFKSELFTLITHKWVELNDMEMFDVYDDGVLKRDNQALLCLFRHIPSQKYIIVGNTHFFHNPVFDYVKHAQAVYALLQASTFVRESVIQIGLIDPEFAESGQTSVPLLFAGDFNSMPVSSAMSPFHGEEIEHQSQWKIPIFAVEKDKAFYRHTNEIYKRLRNEGRLEPLDGRLNSAYNLYY